MSPISRGSTFKTDDKLDHAFFAETTSKLLLFATNGKFYSLDVAKLPGGRGHGEPIRMFIDMEQDAAIVSLFVNKGGRKFLIASREGQGFVVNEDDCVGNTRKGKQVLNVEMPNEACAIATVSGDTVAVIGTNHKMVLFPLDQVPEMARGRGVRLQKYTSAALSDVAMFELKAGLTWKDSAGREQSMSCKELSDWRGNRADAGRLAQRLAEVEQVHARAWSRFTVVLILRSAPVPRVSKDGRGSVVQRCLTRWRADASHSGPGRRAVATIAIAP